jgi:hypothetical protein
MLAKRRQMRVYSITEFIRVFRLQHRNAALV